MVWFGQTLRFISGLPAKAIRWRSHSKRRSASLSAWYDSYDIPWSYRMRLKIGQSIFGNSCAYGRGMKLLLENLSPRQRQQFMRCGYFCVVGGETGRHYRIYRGRQLNVHQLDNKGQPTCTWCFYPEGNLVIGDVMIAQKLALELFESSALAKANRMSSTGQLFAMR